MASSSSTPGSSSTSNPPQHAPVLPHANLPVPFFDGSNYHTWCIKITTYFKCQGMWDIVKNGLPEVDENTLTGAELERYRRNQDRELRALMVMQLAIAESILMRLSHMETPHGMWTALENEFLGTPKVRSIKLQSLKRDLELLEMEEGETISGYYNRMSIVINQIRSLGAELSESRIVEKLLISLTEKFDPIVTSIEETKDFTNMPVSELIGSLEVYERRIGRRREKTSLETAFKGSVNLGSSSVESSPGVGSDGIGGRIRYPPCKVCNKTNHLEKYCWNKWKPQCRFCKNFGHIERNCKQKENRANVAEKETGDDEEVLFFASLSVTCTDSSLWFVDSGCTNHMSPHEEIFDSLDKNYRSRVRLGDDRFIEVLGKGNVSVRTLKGRKIIKDVLFVPALRSNLLSVGQMLENNCHLVFKDGRCEIFDKQNVKLISVPMTCARNFSLKFQYDNQLAQSATEDPVSRLIRKPLNNSKKQEQLQKGGLEGGSKKKREVGLANDGDDNDSRKEHNLENGHSNGYHVDTENSNVNGVFDVNKLQKLGAKGRKRPETVASKDFKAESKKKMTKKNRVWDDSPPQAKLDYTDPASENWDNIEVVSVDHGESMRDKDEIFSSESEAEEDEDMEKDKKLETKKKECFSSMFHRIASKTNLEKLDLEPAVKALMDRNMSKSVAEEIAEKLCESVAARLEKKKLASFTRISSTVQAAMEEALVRIFDILRDVHATKEQLLLLLA